MGLNAFRRGLLPPMHELLLPPENSFCRPRTPSAARELLLPPENSFHRPQGGPPPSRREVFGVENRRSVECRRKIATVRCVCNAGLHHCNGQMYLQPSVAPPSPVGARIARPFIPDVIITLRAGARRVIGATAKPLYAIDGKAEGLDRRSLKTSLFEGGGPSADG